MTFNALISFLFQIIKRPITNGGGEIWGQHPCGIEVPAVGMAFPGYVAQPQLGLGNSEMTCIKSLDSTDRLLVLVGAVGALGATYCLPYIVVDGAYHPCALGRLVPQG
ncbi:hypothetical protein Pint_05555 [Pistacia integerrima]|uniref:Uncharacterized protein n=1 Tax=Pistacia integerrima TaxID=434235 RepID=A0ACC0Z2M9_9ROSI|nr:hypothetical protein Pint_05555 [Pistacia integerrima]